MGSYAYGSAGMQRACSTAALQCAGAYVWALVHTGWSASMQRACRTAALLCAGGVSRACGVQLLYSAVDISLYLIAGNVDEGGNEPGARAKEDIAAATGSSTNAGEMWH